MKQFYTSQAVPFCFGLLFMLLVPSLGCTQGRLVLNHQNQAFYSGCTLHLGQTRVGNPLDVTIRLENVGTTALTGVSASAGGSYSLINSVPVSLNPASPFDLSVRFAATGAGTHFSTLTVSSSDPQTPTYTLTLAATARAASTDGMRLVINEFSNGGFGQQEYIELVAVGEPGTCVDLRGYRIDDNSGRGQTCGLNTGISPGYLEFADHPQWARFPVGGLILIYNPEDINLNIGTFDPFDIDGNLVYSIPINESGLFRLYTASPSPGFGNCNVYNAQGSTRSWNVIGLEDSGDLVQVVRPDGQVEHSIAYILQNSGADVEFPFMVTGEDRVFYLVNNVDTDPKLPSNWSENTTMGFETPGLPNSMENQLWIESLRANIYVCSSTPCSGEPASLHTNARTGISAWNWDFDDNGSGDASETQPTTSFVYPYSGQFRSVLTTESQSGACQIRQHQVLTAINCQRTIVTNLTGDFCLDDSNPALVAVPFNASGTFHPGNTFTLYLVTPSASIAIGTLNGTGSGTINGTIPAGTENGSNYRFRIDASNPPTAGLLSPTWSRIINSDTRVCDIALVSSTSNYAFFDSSPGQCRAENQASSTVYLKAGLSGEPIGVTLNDAVAHVDWLFSATSPNIASMNPFTPAVQGLWYTPYFTAPGTYYVRARANCPCGPAVFSEAIEIRVQSRDSIAYQGGEEDGSYTDCWAYTGFDSSGNPAPVTRLDPPNAKTCEGTLRIANSDATWIEMRDVFIKGVSNPQFSVSYRTDPGSGTGAGIDQRENIQFEYSLDCGATWLLAGLVAGGSDLGFDWTESQVGINNGAAPCCLGGSYSSSVNNCGHCSAPCPMACTTSVASNPLVLNIPAATRNFRVRMRFVNNSLAPTAPNRTDELVYFDDIRLDGIITAQPQVNLVFSGSSAGCRESSAELTASLTNIDLTGACGVQYAFEWWVDGQRVATDLTTTPTATRTITGLRNRSSISARVGIYSGSDPSSPNLNGCLIYCPSSVPIVMDSIPVPSALLTVRDVSSTFVCRPRPSVLRVELEGTAPWNIQYSVNNGPALSVNGITSPTYDFDWFPAADGLYTVDLISVSDAYCTQGVVSGTVNITVTSPPTGVDAGLDQTVCKPNAAPMNVDIGFNTAKIGQWEVVSSPATISLAFALTQFENRLNGVQPGTYALTWTEGANGCTTSDLMLVHVVEPPAILGSSQTRPFCGTEALLIAPPTNPGTGTWQYTSGPTIPVFENLNSPITKVTGLAPPGPYVFTWHVTNMPCGAFNSTLTLDTNSSSGIDGLWRGYQDGDWTRCANWDNMRVPGSNTHVAIRTVATYTPLDWSTVPATQIRSLELNTSTLALPVNRLINPLTISEKLELRLGQLRTDRVAGRVKVISNQMNAVEFHSLNSYVSGILERAVSSGVQYDLPVGTDDHYQFAQVTTDAFFAGPTSLTAQFFDRIGKVSIPPPNIVLGAPFDLSLENGYWNIEPDQPMTAGTYSVRLRKTNANPVGTTYTVARRDGVWRVPQAPEFHISWTLGNLPNYVEAVAGGFSSFSDFDIAYTDQPLFSSQQDFDAQWLDEHHTRLSWHWRSRVPLTELTVERAYGPHNTSGNSVRFLNFIPIQVNQLDHQPLLAVNTMVDKPSGEALGIYYRLRFSHADGSSTCSDIRELLRTDRRSDSEKHRFSVYPNPFSGMLTVGMTLSYDQHVELELEDTKGCRLRSFKFSAALGTSNFPLDLSTFESGIYILKIRSKEWSEQTKVVLMK